MTAPQPYVSTAYIECERARALDTKPINIINNYNNQQPHALFWFVLFDMFISIFTFPPYSTNDTKKKKKMKMYIK